MADQHEDELVLRGGLAREAFDGFHHGIGRRGAVDDGVLEAAVAGKNDNIGGRD